MKLSSINKPALAWIFYDFANSAFATSFLSVIFSVYFANVLVPKEGLLFLGMTIPGESLWGYLISGVMLCVLVVAPTLGHLADIRGLKRSFLLICLISGSLSTLFLFWATPGRLLFAVTFTFLAIFAYELSLVSYNAFLNDITEESSRGRMSGLGFAAGYIGGGLCLAISMFMITHPSAFGFHPEDETISVRASVLLVGVWWFLFSLPVFWWLYDKSKPEENNRLGLGRAIFHSFGQLKATFLHIRQKPHLSRFLLSFLIYDDGIQTILLMASIFGAKELGLSPGTLALCYLLVQFVAFLGALIWGRLADAWSHRGVIIFTLAIFTGIVLWAIVIRQPWEFWLLGVSVGFVMGGAQAASRSLFSLMIPSDKSGEFFSFFSIVGKAAALIGPFVFGVVSQFFGIRSGVASLLIFFLAGGALLLTVNEQKGRHEALE